MADEERSGISMRVTVQDAAVRALLNSMLIRGEDLSPPLREIGEHAQSKVLHNIERQQGPHGPWPPLKDSTVRAKEAAGYSDKALQRTGRMLASFHPHIERDSVSISNDAKSPTGFPYPLVHNFGSKDGRVPQREFAWVDRRDEQAFESILTRHLVGE